MGRSLSEALPSISVAFSHEKTIKVQPPGLTIIAHLSAEALVVEEHGKSRFSLTFRPRKRAGSLELKGHDLALSMHSVLAKTQLRNRDMMSQLARNATIYGTATHDVDFGRASLRISGKTISVPVTAEVSLSVSAPDRVNAEVAIDIPVWDKGGDLTTIEMNVSVDAEILPRPLPRLPVRDPFPSMAREGVHVLENGLKVITEILKHGSQVPGGGRIPPVPAPGAR